LVKFTRYLDQVGQGTYACTMTKQVNLYEAKTHLSQLVDAAARGEEIVIAKNGKPMAKLLSAASESKPAKRVGGQWAKLMTPEELTYHRSEQFGRDWKEWDKEIERDFHRGMEEDWKGYERKWVNTSSTRTPSSPSKKIRPSSGRRPAKR